MPTPSVQVPSTVEEWSASVQDQGIGSRTLGEIAKENPFSGSTIELRPFLQLRAVWTAAEPNDEAQGPLQAAGIFEPEDLTLAEAIRDRMRRSHDDHTARDILPTHDNTPAHGFLQGLGNAKAFLDALDAYRGAGTTTPPPFDSVSGGDAFGAFAPALLNFYNLRPAKQITDTSEGDYSPKVLVYSSPYSAAGAISPPPKINYQRPAISRQDMLNSFRSPKGKDTTSPAEGESSPSVQVQKRKALHDAWTTDRYKDPQPTASEPRQVMDVNPTAAKSEKVPQNVPRPRDPTDGRTEYEVQTSQFFFSFMNALHLHILPLLRNPLVTAIPEERSYHLCRDGSLGNASEQTLRLYTAKPDGVFRVPGKRAFAHFELKPFKRVGAAEKTIRMEETAEMVAIIYQEAIRNEPRNHHLMVSLDGYGFWLVLVTSKEPYRDYIRNHRNAALDPTSPPTSLDEMAQFSTFGPFKLGDRKAMEELMVLMWALILRQVRENTALGTEIWKGIKAQV